MTNFDFLESTVFPSGIDSHTLTAMTASPTKMGSICIKGSSEGVKEYDTPMLSYHLVVSAIFGKLCNIFIAFGGLKNVLLFLAIIDLLFNSQSLRSLRQKTNI